ncbi:MAG: PDZ domain-containing protein [Candidatus Marinimicrobia bacterium]|nr:PDZ domain-containing protein [Candidatus Neomarinimicrobiota bacterium]
MKNKTQQYPMLSTFSAALMAIANGGALVSVIVLTVSFLLATPVNAQDSKTVRDVKLEMNKLDKEIAQAAVEIQEALDEVGIETGIKIHIDEDDEDSRPKLGVYLSDMDFEDAYKMRYPFAHGVLVDGVTNNGNADRAGLIEDDIIMYFDGTKVLYEDHLVRLIRSRNFGDKVELVYWRDEARDTTWVTFQAPVKKEKTDTQLTIVDEKKKDKKHKNSRGWGGGGFTPMLVQDEGNTFADVEAIMTELGLASSPFRSEGIVLWGGSGQGYVGNGWFLGGFGNGGGVSNKVTAVHSNDGSALAGTTVEREISFKMGFGGLTIEKRLAPFSWAVIGGGTGIGLGGIDLNVTQDDGKFTWTNLNDELIETKSTSVNFSKNYFILHPRANVMIRLTSWMRLKAEYGYLYGYGFNDGWKTTLGNNALDSKPDTYELVGSQGKLSELGTTTLSLGLWFGF